MAHATLFNPLADGQFFIRGLCHATPPLASSRLPSDFELPVLTKKSIVKGLAQF